MHGTLLLKDRIFVKNRSEIWLHSAAGLDKDPMIRLERRPCLQPAKASTNAERVGQGLRHHEHGSRASHDRRGSMTARPGSLSLDVRDIRFPTSPPADGSDAINRGDYSAAYVVLRTDRRRRRGARPHVHQRARQRGHVRRGAGAGAPRGRAHPRGHHGRPAGLLAEPHRRRAAALARPGEGRHPHGHGRARQRGLGPVGEARGQADVAAARRADARGARRLRSTSGTSATRSRPTRRSTCCERGAAGRDERASARSSGRAIPAYTTSVGWLGYPDDKVAALSREARRRGLDAVKMKVGARPRGRRRGGPRSSAQEIGPDGCS